jgi:hypothetical protein
VAVPYHPGPGTGGLVHATYLRQARALAPGEAIEFGIRHWHGPPAGFRESSRSLLPGVQEAYRESDAREPLRIRVFEETVSIRREHHHPRANPVGHLVRDVVGYGRATRG